VGADAVARNGCFAWRLGHPQSGVYGEPVTSGTGSLVSQGQSVSWPIGILGARHIVPLTCGADGYVYRDTGPIVKTG
jgi:hypothetical protein